MIRNYKIGIIGFGSIGKRHLSNIESVLENKGYNYTIDLIRTTKNQETDNNYLKSINQIYYAYKEVPNDYDVIFITNPTHMHFQTINDYSHKTKNMFIEKPIFNDININLDDLSVQEGSNYYVACPLRFTDVIQYLKKEVNSLNIYSARAISSSYLPEWRPNSDYRSSYSASEKQGGGVSIDLIHEWDYLQYLFGSPEKVFNIKGKFSNLEIDSDDLSIYIAKYEKMAVEVHLDYFGRENIREIQLFTPEETIIGDLQNSEIRFLKSGKVISFKDSRDDFQYKEMAYFFDMLEGKVDNINDIPSAIKTLKLTKEGVI